METFLYQIEKSAADVTITPAPIRAAEVALKTILQSVQPREKLLIISLYRQREIDQPWRRTQTGRKSKPAYEEAYITQQNGTQTERKH